MSIILYPTERGERPIPNHITSWPRLPHTCCPHYIIHLYTHDGKQKAERELENVI